MKRAAPAILAALIATLIVAAIALAGTRSVSITGNFGPDTDEIRPSSGLSDPSTDTVEVGSVTVAAGTYRVQAKVDVSTSAGNLDTSCELSTSSTPGSGTIDSSESTYLSAGAALYTLDRLQTFGSTTTVYLRCGAGANTDYNLHSSNATLTASEAVDTNL